ncbi:MAG TPA: hypothetical protein VFL92_02900, partial [Sphingomonas sp.]|nr:hypothetical protein [Sphingomonas sp.]
MDIAGQIPSSDAQSYSARAGLRVAEALARFIEEEALPGTGIEPGAFWAGVAGLYTRFEPENAALLAKREDLQARIDAWHEACAGKPINAAEYQVFLREIGYLIEEPAP